MDELKARLSDEMKAAMKAKDKARLQTIRSIQAAIKQVEVDERIEVDDDRTLIILDKMAKQRRESIAQFSQAGRNDLIATEEAELAIIQEFLPAQLSEDEIGALISEAIVATGANSIADMGKLMGQLKPKLQGRADMGAVSALVKAALN